jgi:hypothetical protein
MLATSALMTRVAQVKQRRHKSLFASFSSEKEDSSFFEKKEEKELLFLVLVRRCGNWPVT